MEEFSAGEFLQGFLEEAGEHLQRIHEHLLRLEAQITALLDETALAERAELLAELFRSFHTLKGLASMVGLREAAALSHALESALQALQQGVLTVDQDLIDRLFEGTGTLDLVVNTLRQPGAPMPNTQPVLEALQALTGMPEVRRKAPVEPAAPVTTGREPAREVNAPRPPAVTLVEDLLPGLSAYPEMLKVLGELEQQKIRAGLASGQFFSIVAFVSSAERAARGENVDLLRQELQEQGTLIKAAPVMRDGVFRFLFLVSSPEPLETGLPLADEVILLTGDGTAGTAVEAAGTVVETAGTAGESAAAGQPAQGAEQEPAVAGQKPAVAGPQGSTPRGGLMPSGAGHGAGGAEVVHAAVVRVSLDRLDELMRLTGDLVRLRSRLGEELLRLDGISRPQKRALNATNLQIGRALRDLRRAVLRARMVPLSEAFNRMPLVVRDLARTSQKEIHLTIQGETNEVDKLLVEKLLDPLIHLVRNAITHGIEMPEARAAAGKPAAGSLTLRGTPEGDHILVELVDDGRGIDLRQVAERAAALGLREPDQPLEEIEVLDLISMPGFSTREQADLGAGRGVGLDIVARMVRSFGGQLQMQTKLGQGTIFRLRLPLTMVIVDVLLVRAGQERYAVPRDAVERIIEIDGGSITQVEGGELLPVKINGADSYYVLHRLTRLLGSDGAGEPPQDRLFGLVVPSAAEFGTGSSLGQPVMVVDQVIDMREVVVQTFTDPLVARPGVAGATELGDGGLAIILDLAALLRLAHKSATS